MKKLEAQQNIGLVPRPNDMSRDLTLRNASENRRLKGRLEQYDAQLHHSMVSLQAEIMEIKASTYGQSSSPARLRAIQQQALNNTRGNFVNIDSARQRVLLESARATGRMALSPTPVRRNKPQIQLNSSAGELVLPDINPDNTALVSQGTSKNPKRSLEPNSGGLLQAPTPPSLYKPRSLPDLQRAEGDSRTSSPVSSPRTRRKVRSPLPKTSSIDLESNESGRESNDELKDRINKFISSSQPSSLDTEVTPPDTPSTESGDAIDGIVDAEPVLPDGEKNTEMSEKELALFRNSLLLKASSSEGLSSSMPDLASIGFMDFNELIDKRLRKTQEELPSEEEMRKVRYLRWRNEPKPPDILSVFEKEPTDNKTDGSKTSPRQHRVKNMQKSEA